MEVVGSLVFGKVSAKETVEQRYPRLLPRPVGRQVQGQFPGGVGDPRGDGDQCPADGVGVCFPQLGVAGDGHAGRRDQTYAAVV